MQQNHPPGRLTYNHNIVLYADNPVSGRTLGQGGNPWSPVGLVNRRVRVGAVMILETLIINRLQ